MKNYRSNVILKFFAEFKSKLCLTVLTVFLTYLSVSAQNFTAITWATAAPQKYGVSEAQGRVVNGKLYSFGGFDSRKSTFTPTKRAYVYDPAANNWSAIADLPHTPNGTNFGGITHAGITTDSTDIYIAGGYTSNAAGTGQIFGTKQVWKYNISQNIYTRLPDLPIDIAAGQLEYLEGKIHYIAGTNAARTADLGNHYVLDLSRLADGWKTLAPLPNPRQHAGSAVYNGKIYFIGGQHHHDDNLVTQKDVHVFDPLNNTWLKLADLPVPAGANGRGHISSAAVVMDDRIIVIAGEIAHKNSIKMVSAYSPATNSWVNLTSLPASRFSGVAAVLSGNIYYTGGSKSNITYKGVPVTNDTAFAPLADAFVRYGKYAAINYGSDTALAVKGNFLTDFTRLSYLKFSLAGVTNIVSAKLRIYGLNVHNTDSIMFSVYGINNDTWTERGITYNNAPAASTLALSSAKANNQAKYYDLDVTDFVKNQLAGDKVAGFLIKDTANQNENLVFNSKENSANRPQLVIKFYASRTISDNDTKFSTTFAEDIPVPAKNIKKPLVYPNPVQKTFSIKFPAAYAGDVSVRLSDQAGRIYNIGKIKLQPGGSSINFDISKFSLSQGIYFLKIHSGIKEDEIKLIVQ